MRASRPAFGLAVVVPVVALLAACGGQSESERYGDAFTEVAAPLQAELIDLGNALGSSNRRGPISAALGRANVALDTAAEDFAALDPPADIADIQAELIDAIDGYKAAVETAREALRSDNNTRASKAIGTFNSKSAAFAGTLGEIGDRIEDAGVPLGEPATTGTP